jgi:hypothetical protein
MPKSTPLTQLPRMGDANIGQDRQNHVTSLPMPMNTSTSNDLNEDNDEAIQDALSGITGSNPNMGMQQPVMQQPNMQMNFNSPPMNPEMTLPSSYSPPNNDPRLMAKQNEMIRLQQLKQNQEMLLRHQQQMRLQQDNTEMFKPTAEGRRDREIEDDEDNESNYEGDANNKHIIKRGISDVFDKNSEIKKTFIVFFVFCMAYSIPVENLFVNHVSFEKFPYFIMLIKAIFASLFYVLICWLL